MGCCMNTSGLTPEVLKLVIDVFKEIDKDGNNVIDVKETLEYWKNNFAQLNSNQFFKEVDKDHNCMIDLSEWVQFWSNVKKSGHSEEDIREELENIRNKGTWVHFS